MRTPTDTLVLAHKLPLFDGYMETRKSYKTRELYGYALGHLAKFMLERPMRLDGNDAWREPFREWLIDSGYSKTSIPYHISAVSSYLKFMDGAEISIKKDTELAE